MQARHWLTVLGGHPQPTRLVAARFLEWTGLSRLLTIECDGYRLRFYPTNLTANLWINRENRIHDLHLFKDYCQAGDVVVDVGANIGEVSIISSKQAGPAGRVFAFEPNPRIFRFLRGNLTLNHCRNVTAHNVALGEAAGVVHMLNGKRDDMNRIADDGGLEVPCTTLDAQSLPDRIALLKIDVEGSELQVLRGARQLLQRTQCVNCEMGEAHHRRYGYGMPDLIHFLRQAGFETCVIDRARELRRIDETFSAPGGHELVAIKDLSDFVRRTHWSVS